MVNNDIPEGTPAPAADPIMPFTVMMNHVYRYQDGLNDDMVVDIYNDQNDRDPLFSTLGERRVKHPIVVNDIEIHETIGVEERQTQHELYVYKNGYYDPNEAIKKFGNRTGSILHQLRLMAEGVLQENQEPDRDDHTPAAQSTRAVRKKAVKIIDYVEKTHNSGARTSIYRRTGQRNSVPIAKLNASDNVFALPNGALIYDISSKTVTYDEHFHPEALNTMIASIPYVKDARCPKFDTFVKDALSYKVGKVKRTDTANISEEIRLFWQWAGYQLIRGNPYQAVMQWIGSSGSGKGTIKEVITGVMGTYALQSRRDLIVSQTGPGKIRSDQGNAVEKHAVFVDELNENDIIDSALVKNMTNPTVTVEKKYQNPYERVNNCKVTIISNYENRWENPDGSITRRLMLLGFYKPEEKVPDIMLAKRFISEEGAGVLNRMIEGLIDLMENGFVVPEHIKKQVESYLTSQDRLAMFLAQHLPKTNPNDTPVRTRDVWRVMTAYYQQWEEKPPVANSSWLGRLLRNRGYDISTAKGVSFIKGCMLLPSIGLEEKIPEEEEQATQVDSTLSNF